MRILRMLSALAFCLGLFFPISALTQGSFVDGSLPVEMGGQKAYRMNSSEGAFSLEAVVHNPASGSLDLYLMERKGELLELVQGLGKIPAGGNLFIQAGIKAKYKFSPVEKRDYAIVGVDSKGGIIGRNFQAKISWEEYERGTRQALSYANTYVLPGLGVLVVIIIAVLLEIGHRMERNPEYSLKTLFFPSIRGKPLGEALADIMTDPFFWLLEAACVGILLAAIYTGVVSKVGLETGAEIVLLSGLGALALPLIYIMAARLSERYEKKPMRFFFGLFAWGGFAAFLSFLASYLQMPLFNALGLSATAISFSFFSTALLAPLVEELMKGLGILAASAHHEFDDTLSGLLFGFTVGVGFSFVENWFYFTSRTNPFELGVAPWASLVLYRSFFNSIAHGCFGAATASVIGYMKSHPKARWISAVGFLPGLFAAVALHIIFNVSALLDGFAIANYEVPFFIFNPALVVLMSIMFMFVYVAATNEEKVKYLGRRARDIVREMEIA